MRRSSEVKGVYGLTLTFVFCRATGLAGGLGRMVEIETGSGGLTTATTAAVFAAAFATIFAMGFLIGFTVFPLFILFGLLSIFFFVFPFDTLAFDFVLAAIGQPIFSKIA